MDDKQPIVELQNVDKYFLHSRALRSLSLEVRAGETLGIVGHNGAGKSTLVNILTGTLQPSSGTVTIAGTTVDAAYSVFEANKLGVRAVFQDLSLCPNLSVLENMRVFHPSLKGWAWEKDAESMLMDVMNTIFPGHGIRGRDIVENLSLGQRQIVEIAKAFVASEQDSRLVILDEPTSALDHQTSAQLIEYVNSLHGKPLSVIYISHLLDEVLACTSRIIVLKDGAQAGVIETKDASRQTVIRLMGEARPLKEGQGTTSRGRESAEKRSNDAPFVVEPAKAESGIRVRVRQGEIVGLTGLAGHGQSKLLLDLYDYRSNRRYRVRGPVTFVPGDRQAEGVFPVWSIAKNLSIQVYDKIRKLLLISTRLEREVAEKWRKNIDIKGGSMQDNILSLSGGNQQKVLFARCLEASAPLVLMDDPTRGVDVGTKEELYKLVIEESRHGKAFVWYTTEMDELKYCDRIYVFKAGKILAELGSDEATEEEILKASF